MKKTCELEMKTELLLKEVQHLRNHTKHLEMKLQEAKLQNVRLEFTGYGIGFIGIAILVVFIVMNRFKLVYNREFSIEVGKKIDEKGHSGKMDTETRREQTGS